MALMPSPSVMSSTNIPQAHGIAVGRELPCHLYKASKLSSAGRLLEGEGTGKELRLGPKGANENQFEGRR